MNMNEIATAVREQLPLIQVVVNNHVLEWNGASVAGSVL